MRGLRKLLDWLYTACGILAAIFLIAILLLIVLQMSARWTGEIFPGAPEYAGYSMAAASFFAFASALNRGSHIRVSIVLNILGRRARRIVDAWCFAIGAALAEAFERAGLRAMLGDYTMAEHEFVVAARALCAKAGISFALRSDIQDIVPLPKAIAQSVGGRDLVARQTHERVFIHMLKMIAMALNADFHAMMRETLAAHTVAGKGLFKKVFCRTALARRPAR